MVILSLGLHPASVDYSRYPGLDEPTLTARIEVGHRAIREAGFDIVPCQVSADPAEAEATVREFLATHRAEVAMIGAGVRMAPEHTLLFERLVNLIIQLAPGIVFCFNTSPETTVDALRRGVGPN